MQRACDNSYMTRALPLMSVCRAARPGFYESTLPIVLDDDFERPYQYLKLTAEYHCPRLSFDPLAIVLTPVPLDTEVSAEFQILASGYRK